MGDPVANVGADERDIVDEPDVLEPRHGRLDNLLIEAAVDQLAAYLEARPLSVGQVVEGRVDRPGGGFLGGLGWVVGHVVRKQWSDASVGW